jgi:iron complex transport system substrate-binding protein
MQSYPRTRRALRPVIGLLAAVLVAALLAACGGDDAEPAAVATAPAGASAASAFPVSVTDSSGTQLTFSAAPKRIISYSPGATEVLFAIGAGSQVVATDKFSDYPKETAALPKLEYSKPAPEPAVALTPDLVIMATNQQGQMPQFRALGMKVLFLKEPADIAGVLEQIRTLSKVTGRAADGEALASGLQKRIDAVAARVAKAPAGPKVFYELSPDGFTVGPESFLGALLKLAKAANVAEKATDAFPKLGPEVVIAANPDVIILADGGSSGGQSLETVKARPGWATLNAVKNGRVHAVDPNVFNRPGPRIVDALEELVKLCYPGLG